MWNEYVKFWKKYVDFKGRSSRSEYWFASLFNSVVILILSTLILSTTIQMPVVSGIMPRLVSIFIVLLIWDLATLLPNLAIIVRRLRDGGFPWGFVFFLLIPYVGPLVILIFMFMPTKIQTGMSSELNERGLNQSLGAPDQLGNSLRENADHVSQMNDDDTDKEQIIELKYDDLPLMDDEPAKLVDERRILDQDDKGY
ncbi:DUF805 domain-containing protein [Weissella coleopterorum]|uniref:DUF805 domain-containing protein n=1 Tax=Weissella coleopterorum TaxID=2714949 RepID=A0A6G8AZH7_9LACO|nr:DUF805 domain-containing protein [Weissella coleopterorum]QIL50365.1 DUF805 domain-containing protein [Weissella coleopterorum]